MGFLEQIGQLTVRLLTLDQEQTHLKQEQVRQDQQVQNLEARIRSLEERVLRLEDAREFDRGTIENVVTRFQLEVERAELRLKQLPSPTEP